MNKDSLGLPVNVNPDGTLDANDQLQRVGMIAVAEGIEKKVLSDVPTLYALIDALQPKPGIYVRYVGGNANNVSADQLIAALAAHVIRGDYRQVGRMFLQMCKRLGFAQNTVDGLNGDNTARKIPDFMLLRSLPLFARAHALLYPVAVVCDSLLVLAALSAVGPVFPDGSILPRRRSPDDVDDNNTILTLAVCSTKMPTPLSYIARKIYAKLRPWNLGCVNTLDTPSGALINNKAYHPVYGALRHYHRAESGGNPEIAELWAPICKRLFE